MLKQKIAILGATGQIGKNLFINFSKEENFEVSLFSRNEKKLEKILEQIKSKQNLSVRKYDELNKSQYDTIINCVGLSDPAALKDHNNNILEITKMFDDMTLKYLKNNTKTKLINFSSGIIYGGEFNSPIKDTVLINEKNQKNFDSKSPYTIAKVNSEVRHRKLREFNIIDLRLFSFFSRFMNIESKFFLSEIILSIKEKKKFLTDKHEIYRDYIHPEDLSSFVKKCIYSKPLNDVFDLQSKQHISKFEILNFLKEKHDLHFEIIQDMKQPDYTEFKRKYYTDSNKTESLGFKPKYSSLDTILDELPYFLTD